MTTEVRRRWVDNVFQPNDVISLPVSGMEHLPNIAGAAWLLKRKPIRQAHAIAAEEATAAIRASVPKQALYLMAGHTAAQPRTRVVRHRKLWSALSARGLPLVGDDLGEWMLEANDGIRFFGLRRLGIDDVKVAVAIMEEEAASLLVSIPEESEPALRMMVAHGWSAKMLQPSNDIIIQLAKEGGVALWLLGAFDDNQAGVALVGPPKLLNVVRLAAHDEWERVSS